MKKQKPTAQRSSSTALVPMQNAAVDVATQPSEKKVSRAALVQAMTILSIQRRQELYKERVHELSSAADKAQKRAQTWWIEKGIRQFIDGTILSINIEAEYNGNLSITYTARQPLAPPDLVKDLRETSGELNRLREPNVDPDLVRKQIEKELKDAEMKMAMSDVRVKTAAEQMLAELAKGGAIRI